ncbi:MAG: S41 family peptidase [Bacteroidota bacterium]
MSGYKNSNYQIRLPIIITVAIAGGILIGATFTDKPTVVQNDLGKSMQKFKEVLTLIDRNYVDQVDTDELVEDAIEHMLTNLDPHSAYIPAKDKIQANEGLQGNFEGIGIEFNIFKDTIVVVSPLSGGPSEAVGLISGDKIIEVDSKVVAGVGFTNRDVQKTLKGPKGSEVEVTVKRKGKREPIVFNIIRDKIPQQSVDASYMITDEIGYIKVSRFSATTYDEFKAALEQLKKDGMEKLVLDLQGNPGGYMNHAINMVDEFVPDDKKIVYTQGKQTRFNSQAFADRKGLFEEGELIVLVNEGSASASEIVSGALQDNDRALIVGRRSFGKGLVQAPMDLSDGSELRLTISRYYTPSGRSIQKPYVDYEDYSKDLIARFEHGEFFSSDSIKFNDSLKYETASGRTVYGGGGIMPDYFVPLDTSMTSAYLNRLFTSNSMQEYTFNFVAKNKDRLNSMDYNDYYQNFDVSQQMLDGLVKTGKLNEVVPDLKDLNKNKDLFKLHLKAQIARQIWNNNGFYPIFNQTNEILQQAVKLFDKAEELDRTKM